MREKDEDTAQCLRLVLNRQTNIVIPRAPRGAKNVESTFILDMSHVSIFTISERLKSQQITQNWIYYGRKFKQDVKLKYEPI